MIQFIPFLYDDLCWPLNFIIVFIYGPIMSFRQFFQLLDLWSQEPNHIIRKFSEWLNNNFLGNWVDNLVANGIDSILFFALEFAFLLYCVKM